MRKIFPATYYDLQYELEEVKQLVMMVFEHLGEAPDIEAQRNGASASAYLLDIDKYRAALSGCVSLIHDMADEIDVRLESGCEQ